MKAVKRMFCETDIAPSRLKTRAQRRRIVRRISVMLQTVRDAEESCLSRYPDNLQESDQYMNGETALEALSFALDFLDDVY